MATNRIDWCDLPAAARASIEAVAGPVVVVDAVAGGLNSAVAAVLHAESGRRVFVKGLPDPAPSQRREAAVGRYVGAVSPALLWEVRAGGWHFLAFEVVEGRTADYSVDSVDLWRVVDVLQVLGQLGWCPDGELVKRAEQRWGAYIDDPACFAGDQLLHTDLRPDNVLVSDAGAQLVDWAWPTRGAGWIDAACWVPHLIAAGHPADEAEVWAGRAAAAWDGAPTDALDQFALAQARMWEQIARDDAGDPWKTAMAAASRGWYHHRAARLL